MSAFTNFNERLNALKNAIAANLTHAQKDASRVSVLVDTPFASSYAPIWKVSPTTGQWVYQVLYRTRFYSMGGRVLLLGQTRLTNDDDDARTIYFMIGTPDEGTRTTIYSEALGAFAAGASTKWAYGVDLAEGWHDLYFGVELSIAADGAAANIGLCDLKVSAMMARDLTYTGPVIF